MLAYLENCNRYIQHVVDVDLTHSGEIVDETDSKEHCLQIDAERDLNGKSYNFQIKIIAKKKYNISHLDRMDELFPLNFLEYLHFDNMN